MIQPAMRIKSASPDQMPVTIRCSLDLYPEVFPSLSPYCLPAIGHTVVAESGLRLEVRAVSWTVSGIEIELHMCSHDPRSLNEWMDWYRKWKRNR
jgi:hypothetical protein